MCRQAFFLEENMLVLIEEKLKGVYLVLKEKHILQRW